MFTNLKAYTFFPRKLFEGQLVTGLSPYYLLKCKTFGGMDLRRLEQINRWRSHSLRSGTHKPRGSTLLGSTNLGSPSYYTPKCMVRFTFATLSDAKFARLHPTGLAHRYLTGAAGRTLLIIIRHF